jgi:hypothetical protein
MTPTLKVINFHVIEDKEIGLAEVYISTEVRSQMDPERELSLTDMNMLPENMEQIFAVVNKNFFQDKAMQYIFVSKDEVDISDYYELIYKFLQERCDFYDHLSPVQFKVNSY